MTDAAAVILIAKEPRPGRVKTRLCPPCEPAEAAALAGAALADTVAAIAGKPGCRRVVALDGEAGAWIPEGFEVQAQVAGGLDARIAAALESVGQPALVVGMDTPQITSELIADALGRLLEPGTDAVLGAAPDGGYWALGLREPRGAAVAGVPMSVPWTATAQRARLDALGLRRRELRELRDVDDFDDARAVAALCPDGRFAACLREVEARLRTGLAPGRAGAA